MERLIKAAGRNRYGERDALMVLLAFRHGLRAAEVVDMRWEQVDFKTASLHVRRAKNGTPSTHPLTGRELRALRKHQRESPKSPFVFVSERDAPFSAPGFSRMVERAGVQPSSASRRMPICCAMRRDLSLQTMGSIPARSRPISGTGIFRTRQGTPRWPRIGSRGSFGTELQGELAGIRHVVVVRTQRL